MTPVDLAVNGVAPLGPGELTITILGCGTSSGVPMANGDWGTCDRTDPRNRRRRPSLMVEARDKRLVIDTGPDFREQMLTAQVDWVDAILYTHDHADHTHGIDDLRSFSWKHDGLLPTYAGTAARDSLISRFQYFTGNGDGAAEKGPKPHIKIHSLAAYKPTGVCGIPILPIDQDHGVCRSLGFRLGRFAYSTDVVRLDERALAHLGELDTWIVDCLRDKPHPTHAHLDQVLAWVERLRPRRTYLTHLGTLMDYRSLAARLPAGVAPSHDGQTIYV